MCFFFPVPTSRGIYIYPFGHTFGLAHSVTPLDVFRSGINQKWDGSGVAFTIHSFHLVLSMPILVSCLVAGGCLYRGLFTREIHGGKREVSGLQIHRAGGLGVV